MNESDFGPYTLSRSQGVAGGQVAGDTPESITQVSAIGRGLYSPALVVASDLVIAGADGDATGVLWTIRHAEGDESILGELYGYPSSLFVTVGAIGGSFSRWVGNGAGPSSAFNLWVEMLGATGPTSLIYGRLTIYYNEASEPPAIQ